VVARAQCRGATASSWGPEQWGLGKPVAEEIIGGEALLQSVSEDLAGEEESSNTGLFGFAEALLRLACPGM